MSHEVNVTWFPDSPLGAWKIVEARTPENERYTGSLLVGRLGSLLLCQWSTTLGSFSGVGLLHNGRMLVARTAQGHERPGIVRYTLTSTGQLDAVWATDQMGGLQGTGIAQPVAPTSGTPQTTCWDVLYYDENGNKTRALRVCLAARGEVFDTTWHDLGRADAGTPCFDGVGRATPTGFAAAWSRTEGHVEVVKTLLMYEPTTPGEAAGTSATQGCDRLGEEVLRRIL